MWRPEDKVNELTEKIIGCAIEVHRALGPGLLESVYRVCLVAELQEHSLSVRTEVPVPLTYKNKKVGVDLRLDLLVENSVIVELKAIERLHSIHLAQVITYLKLTGHPVGLLMNFNATSLRAGLRRLDRPDRFGRSIPP